MDGIAIISLKPQPVIVDQHPVIVERSQFNRSLGRLKWRCNYHMMDELKLKISADADGGPRSRVHAAGHSAQPPIDVSENF